MKVGDYVRTNDGYIAKYLGCKTNSVNQLFHYFDGTIRNIASYVYEEDKFLWDDELKNIIKSSPNIIDLIEVGDYVNGYKVLKNFLEDGGNIILFENGLCATNEDIKSILTKEQFESMEYRLGEDK